MAGSARLIEAIETLGQTLAHRNRRVELAVVGGAALLLQNLIFRSTLDMDVIAVISDGGQWEESGSLPDFLVTAVRDVAEALDLPRQPGDEKDWLDAGPGILMQLGLPPGFRERMTVERFGGLTLHIASRVDLIHLKFWSATDPARGARREVDVEDLRTLAPTAGELYAALAWCAKMDGRRDFISVNAAPVFRRLGFPVGEMKDE